ncbi:FecR domain-containing protein, partial [Pseudomonas aeruginosa]
LGGWWQPGDWLQDWRADYVAAPGQVAEWKLADGSYLSLDAGSAVRVRIDGGQRRVELLRGAATDLELGAQYPRPPFARLDH